MPTTPLIRFDNVSYALPGGRVLFNAVNFEIFAEEVVLLMGASGCGKSTLLRMMTGQIRPDDGEVWVGEYPVHAIRGEALFAARKQLGMLFQSGALFTDLNVFENVAFPMRAHLDMPEEMLHDLVLLKLQAVGLRGAKDLRVHELSGGMMRRVALARAIMMDPKIMLYDEPLAGQDPISVAVLLRLIQSLNQSFNITSVVVAHELKVIASIVDRVLMVSAQKVIDCGTPAAMLDHADPQVREFVAGSLMESVPFHYPAPAFKQALSL
jgi:phospholipid/cholesterol/gamma-HCH transport system ATP-binding protein